jgi:predicted translin family RNA/ssDNA-binding protein
MYLFPVGVFLILQVDMQSISYAACMTTQLYELLLQFDFRNSPLRRKYDSLKYAVKKFSELQYELSIANSLSQYSSVEPPTKRCKSSEEINNSEFSGLPLVPSACFLDIRGRFELVDRSREEVIKLSRDVQKNAKLAIFAVHRGNLQDARVKLGVCAKVIFAILTLHLTQVGI